MHEVAAGRFDRGEIAAALEKADVSVLMMVLVEMTGDRSWIEPPYQPRREAYFFADESSGLPEELQDAVRAAALDVIHDFHHDRLAAAPEPSDELYLEMMRVCVAERIPPGATSAPYERIPRVRAPV